MRKFLLLIALIISGVGFVNAQNVGDNTIIDYGSYSLKFTVTSVAPAECKVICSKKPNVETIINIPTYVKIKENNVTVTSIGYAAFYACDLVTNILFEENSQITMIDERAFLGCYGLTSIKIPSGVALIGPYAFRNCTGLKSVTFENNSQLTSIGEYAFLELPELKSIAIPKSVTTIGKYAFSGCSNLKSVTFQENSQLVSIGDSAFSDCGSLSGVEIPSSVTIIGSGAFRDCSGLTNVVFGEDSQLVSIGSYTFYSCDNLSNIEIPGSVTTIGGCAFSCCFGLTNVVFGENSQLTSIEAKTFGECYNLTNVKLPNTIKSIGDNAFQNSKLTAIELPGTITYIGSEAFRGCGSLKSLRCLAEIVPETGIDVFYYVPSNMNIQVPETSINLYQAVSPWGNYRMTKVYPFFDGEFIVKDYGDYSLRFTAYTSIEGCSVQYETKPNKSVSIVIPSVVELNGNNINVTNIEVEAFADCSKITSVKIPNSVIVVKGYAFENCINLLNVIFEEDSRLISIGMYAFSGCTSLKGVEIPDGVCSIEKCSFQSCSKITNIKIPNSVTSIEQNAFYGCLDLKEIMCYSVAPAELGSYGYAVLSAFANIHSDAKIYVPSISLDEYKSQWSSHSNIIIGMPTYTLGGWIDSSGNSVETPEATDNVVINAPMLLSGNTRTNNVLTVNTIGITENGSLAIKNGGQLVANSVAGEVTVENAITGCGDELSWYTISSPMRGELLPSNQNNATNLLSGNYELYRYDEPTYTWQNYKNSANNGFTSLELGRGYIYANSEDVVLSFTGNVNTDNVVYHLTNNADVLTGFHLIGNPFTHNITSANFILDNATLAAGYYVLSNEGDWGVRLANDGVIKPTQGALIKATITDKENDATITLNNDINRQLTTDTRQNSRYLSISVSNDKHSDEAIVMFGEGIGLDKINHQNENSPLLYIPMTDANYAVAFIDNNFNEVPINFEANVMGQYTISLKQENCEFKDLYLFDKQSGQMVNVLEKDYTFIASVNDESDRFILLKDNSQQTTDNSHFAYVSGEELIINAEGIVQIIDMMGRLIYSDDVETDNNKRIDMSGFDNAAYIIRCINENGIKVQKVIL